MGRLGVATVQVEAELSELFAEEGGGRIDFQRPRKSPGEQLRCPFETADELRCPAGLMLYAGGRDCRAAMGGDGLRVEALRRAVLRALHTGAPQGAAGLRGAGDPPPEIARKVVGVVRVEMEWQGRQDLNLRRTGLESVALAGLSYAPSVP